MQYYSALKKNEILLCAKMWMNVENSMLNKRSQTQKHIL